MAIITRYRALAVLLAAFTALAVCAAPAGAATKRTNLLRLGCGAQTVVQPFTSLGDSGRYVAVPNGGLENGATGWTLTGGARVVQGNEPFFVGGSADSSSLYLPAGSSATSPAMCVKLLDPTVRFFATGTGSAELRADVLYRTILGRASLHYADISPGPWNAPPPSLYLANLCGPILSLDLLTATVQFKFTAPSRGGTFQIDDLYVDPWVST